MKKIKNISEQLCKGSFSNAVLQESFESSSQVYYIYPMTKNGTFLWYDLETFGKNPAFDRIAQFACRRTDMELNPIGDPVVLYCRLSADYLPDPEACLVTGITPQEVKAKGIPECEFIERINNLMKTPNTCTVGFNSIHFDDEFIRNTLYRNLLDPYEREYRNNCSRWDILDLVRATHDLRPQGINWPNPSEKGNPVFKLTELTAANNIDQTGAHDAMVDVDATIAVARLIKEKQPKLFNHFLKLRSKTEVKNLLHILDTPEPLLHVNRIFTNPQGCTSLILPLTPSPEADNNVYCFDLSEDPSPLFAAQDENFFRTKGLFRLAINKCPFLAPLNVLRQPEDFTRLGIDFQLCTERYETITANRNLLIQKIRDLRNREKEENTRPDDTDSQLYSGFFSDRDRKLFSLVRNAPADQKLNLNLEFTDPRCRTMVFRYVCRNYPQYLTQQQTQEWKSFALSRLLCPPGDYINDIHFLRRKIKERLNDKTLDGRARQVLSKLLEYESQLRKYLNYPEVVPEDSPDNGSEDGSEDGSGQQESSCAAT